MLFVAVNRKGLFFVCAGNGYCLCRQINFQFCFWVSQYSCKYLVQKFRTHLYREDSDIKGIVFKNISKKARYHTTEAIIIYGPCGMFAAAAAAEVFAPYQYFTCVGTVI